MMDVYSTSFGDQDDGKTVQHRSGLMEAMLANNAKLGRNGIGSSFVVPAGNGGFRFDHCSVDRMVNSIYSIVVAGILKNRSTPKFAERCASIMTSAFTGDGTSNGIVTAGPDGTCNTNFYGTSAAVPMVAAIIALGLEANRNLTYRQIQALIVVSSKKPSEEKYQAQKYAWWKNGAGLWVSDLFGYGVLNPELFVRNAIYLRNKTSPELHLCNVPINHSDFETVGPNTFKKSRICTRACEETNSAVVKLEHLVLEVSIVPMSSRPSRRGKLAIEIKSPQQRPIWILGSRLNDDDRSQGFRNQSFTSVLHWFEDPRGCWDISIVNLDSNGWFVIQRISLKFFGVNNLASEYFQLI
ncbi:hypothetical protein ACOME3_004256 [Neoechinorhynchus agilis]